MSMRSRRKMSKKSKIQKSKNLNVSLLLSTNLTQQSILLKSLRKIVSVPGLVLIEKVIVCKKTFLDWCFSFKYCRLRVKPPSAPTNIQWKNISSSKQYTNIRRFCINILELIFLAASFYFLMYWQIEKMFYIELLTPSTCSSGPYTADTIAENWGNKAYLQCYCQATFPGATVQDQMYTL